MSRLFHLRPLALVFALAALALLSAAAGDALARDPYQLPERRQADVHNPYSSSYLPLRPNQPIRQGPSSRMTVPTWPWFGNFSERDFFFRNSRNGPAAHFRARYLPYPLLIPADALYGPQAINPIFGGGAGPQVPLSDEPIEAMPVKRPTVRASNASAKAKAGKFIAWGDAQFRAQKYSRAISRYRTASEMAPDVAEAYIRTGLAYLAMGHYEAADKAFRRALELRPNWTGAELRLDDLYAGDAIAKTTHREALAKAVEASPFDPTLLFLLGMHLHFDGQTKRAESFLTRCAQLGGNHDGALSSFIGGQEGFAEGGRGKRVEF